LADRKSNAETRPVNNHSKRRVALGREGCAFARLLGKALTTRTSTTRKRLHDTWAEPQKSEMIMAINDAYVEAVNRAREMLVWSPTALAQIAEALEEAMAEAEWAGDPRADNIEKDVLSVVAHAQALFEKAKRAGDCRIQQFERTEALVASGLDIGEIGRALSRETEEAKRAGVLRIESAFFDEAEETIGKAEKQFWALFGSEKRAMEPGPDDDWLKDWRVTDD
jgi:hypothetical protein